MYKKQETKIKKQRRNMNVGSFATRVRLRNAVKQRRRIMNQRESLNIQNQSIEGAVTCVMSYLKAKRGKRQGKKKSNRKRGNENKKQVCRK